MRTRCPFPRWHERAQDPEPCHRHRRRANNLPLCLASRPGSTSFPEGCRRLQEVLPRRMGKSVSADLTCRAGEAHLLLAHPGLGLAAAVVPRKASSWFLTPQRGRQERCVIKETNTPKESFSGGPQRRSTYRNTASSLRSHHPRRMGWTQGPADQGCPVRHTARSRWLLIFLTRVDNKASPLCWHSNTKLSSGLDINQLQNPCWNK